MFVGYPDSPSTADRTPAERPTLLQDLTQFVPRVRDTATYKLASGTSDLLTDLVVNATKETYKLNLDAAQAMSNFTG